MSELTAVPPFHYCPYCAAPLPQATPFRQPCPVCQRVLYHNSSPCVGALPIDREGRILLGVRAIEPFKGGWNTIGGFLEYGEHPHEGLRREVREETGADCTVGCFVAACADTYGHDGPALLNLYFRVDLLSDALQPCDDVARLEWFSLDRLPDDIPFAADRQAFEILRTTLP